MKKLTTKIVLSSIISGLSYAQASTVLFYDSTTTTIDSLGRIDSLTDSSLIASSDSTTSLGSNSVFQLEHANQTNTVTLGDGDDRAFRFGGLTTSIGEGATVINAAYALNSGHHIGASFTAAQDISLTSFSYNLQVNNFGGHAAADSGLFFSVDNGASFTQFGDIDNQTANGNRGTITFTDTFLVESGQSVEFRLAFADRTQTDASRINSAATRIGSINISATAVPEPSSVALLGLGGLALLMRRRK